METKIALLEGEMARLTEHRAVMETTLQQAREEAGAEFAKQTAYIARLEEEQKSKNEHITYLEKLLQGIEAGRVMRLTRAISRFLGR